MMVALVHPDESTELRRRDVGDEIPEVIHLDDDAGDMACADKHNVAGSYEMEP